MVLHGLVSTSRSHLNGRHGVVRSATGERWTVELLADGESVSLQPESLALVEKERSLQLYLCVHADRLRHRWSPNAADRVPVDGAAGQQQAWVEPNQVVVAVGGPHTDSEGVVWIKLEGNAGGGGGRGGEEGGGGGGDRWVPTTKASDGSTLLRQVARRVTPVEAGAIRTLLPPPPAAQYWLDGGEAFHPDNTTLRNAEAAAAAEWLVEAVSHAHVSPAIKATGRALMQADAFTRNLEAFSVHDAGGRRLGSVWEVILMPQLDAKLATLGAAACAANAAAHIATALGSAAVAACSARHPAYPPGTRARQDEAMPAVARQFDFEHGWRERPEHIYIHTLCLVALALDPLFAAALAVAASDVEGGAVEVHAALTKSYGRMAGKMVAADDHRYDPHPRPAQNIDIVRRLAVVETTGAARQLIAGVSARFGGLSYLKCLADLGSGPAAAARYHMLPMMLTVEFAPAGWTVGRMLDDPAVQAAWAARRAARPGSVSEEQWAADHDAAVAALRRVDRAVPLKQHCEVQLVLQPVAVIRHGMHELYKVKRADSGVLLHADAAPAGDVDSEHARSATSLHAHSHAACVVYAPKESK